MQGSSEVEAETEPTQQDTSADAPERRRPEPAAVEQATTATEQSSEGPAASTSDPASPDVIADLGDPAEETTNDVGATILEEARLLLAGRRFRDAARVLESVERLRPDDPETLSLIAITHANLGRNRKLVSDALRRLSNEFGDRSLTWRTVSEVALARFQFDPAQQAARTSVQMAPRSVRNWHALAASYAGNGWFSESEACIAEATKIDPVGQYELGTSDVIGFGQWQVGRAVNYWAMTRTYVAIVAMLGFLWFGLLGLAVALSTPMLVREIRVRTAPEPFRTLADLAWRGEHRIRLLNATVVGVVLLLWLLLFTIVR